MKTIRAVYEKNVFKPLDSVNLKNGEEVLIKIIDEKEIDEIVNSIIIKDLKRINYDRLKVEYYESL